MKERQQQQRMKENVHVYVWMYEWIFVRLCNNVRLLCDNSANMLLYCSQLYKIEFSQFSQIKFNLEAIGWIEYALYVKNLENGSTKYAQRRAKNIDGYANSMLLMPSK